MATAPHRTVVGVFGDGLVARRTEDFLGRFGFDVRRHAVSRVEPSVAAPLEVAVTATSSRHQVALASQLLGLGVSVVSTADQPGAVRQLMRLERRCRPGQSLVVGAAYAPGLTSMIAAYLGADLERIDAITTARFGTGGPTCAREHHRSMAAPALMVEDGAARWVRGGSGRQLVWFPEPAGPADCYRGGLAEPNLLHRAFPNVARIQSLQAATRRDRLTAQLPMLRRPHAEGRVGAVWVEVRGVTASGAFEHRVLGASGPQATGAAATAALLTRALIENGVPDGVSSPAELADPARWLRHLPTEVALWAYDGSVVAESSSFVPIQAARKWSRP